MKLHTDAYIDVYNVTWVWPRGAPYTFTSLHASLQGVQ